MSCWLAGFVMCWSSRGAVFSLGRKAQQFCEARFVSVAHGTFAVRLNPFRMFPEQGLVDLLLKLNVSLNVVRTRLRRVRIHVEYDHQQATSSQCACVGFSVATHGATCPTSFEVEERAGFSVRGYPNAKDPVSRPIINGQHFPPDYSAAKPLAMNL